MIEITDGPDTLETCSIAQFQVDGCPFFCIPRVIAGLGEKAAELDITVQFLDSDGEKITACGRYSTKTRTGWLGK